MRRTSYLNVILTVNALLLAALLWTQVADRPVLAKPAIAEPPSMPNAAEQRQKIINALQDLEQSVSESTRLLESGKLEVQVTNLHEIQSEAPDQG